MTWILPVQERLASPNCYRDRRGYACDVLVIHFAVDGDQTDDDHLLMEVDGQAIDRNFTARLPSDDCMDVARGFFRKSRAASANLVIGRDGSKVECVPTHRAAWHAGDGALPREGIGPLGAALPRRAGEMNCRSYGIEMCNVGWAVDKFEISPERVEAGLRHRNPASRSTRWESFRPVQYETLRYCVGRLRQDPDVGGTLRFVCGHEDLTHAGTLGRVGGKLDPGPAFDWDAIDWDGLGFTRIAYDFRLKAWVAAGDEITRPIDIRG